MDIPVTAKAALLQVLLIDGPGYGQELAERIEARTRGGMKLLQGSIYPALVKFIDTKLVSTRTVIPEGSGRERVYYKLTEKGEALAKQNQDILLGLFSRTGTTQKALASTESALRRKDATDAA